MPLRDHEGMLLTINPPHPQSHVIAFIRRTIMLEFHILIREGRTHAWWEGSRERVVRVFVGSA